MYFNQDATIWQVGMVIFGIQRETMD